MKLYPICFTVLTFFSSCIGPYALQHSLNENKVPLCYTFDSQIDSLKTDCKIYLKVIDNLRLNDTTKVTGDGFLVIPLIVAGGYKYDFKVTLGKNSVQPSFPEFIYDSFVTEANRSGDFFIKKRAFRSDYIVEMTLLNCTVSTQYHKDRIRYAHYSRENWILKPITGTFSIAVRLLHKKAQNHLKAKYRNLNQGLK